MTRYAKILKADISNGLGFRTTVFFTGCDLKPHCKGCFNEAIWSPEKGKDFTEETVEKIIKVSKPFWCEGLSILGGEPTAPWNIETATSLAKAFKAAFPSKDVWAWSGRYKDAIEKLDKGPAFLDAIDVLIDGPFIEELKDMSLRWKGSSNQRLWRKTNGVWFHDTDPMM